MVYENAQLRFEHYDSIYISPHMDDAAFSCGGRILLERQQQKRVLVVTVFGTGGAAAERPGGAFADYDRRKVEELEVMRALDADFVWLNQPELLFRRTPFLELVRYMFPFMPLSRSALQRELHDQLLALCTRHLAPGGTVYFPFSVGFHPDHRILFDVGRALHAAEACAIRFYEDIPYALTPALRTRRLGYLGLPSPAPLLADAREIHRFLFWRVQGVRRGLTRLWVLWYLFVSHVLQALSRARDSYPDEPAPLVDELDIGSVAAHKLRVMALYPSQISELFPDGLHARLFADERGRSVERTWRLPVYPPAAVRQRAFLALPGGGGTSE